MPHQLILQRADICAAVVHSSQELLQVVSFTMTSWIQSDACKMRSQAQFTGDELSTAATLGVQQD